MEWILIFNEGRDAFNAGEERKANPYVFADTYTPSNDAAREWYRGYDKARTESYRRGGSTLQNKAAR